MEIVWRPKLITAPAAEPVTAADVRTWGGITSQTSGAMSDTVLNDRIKAARELCEDISDLKFITQTWAIYGDAFPDWEICLPCPPWLAITTVKYYDTDGTQQTLSSTLYTFDSVGGRLTPAYGQSWPSTRDMMNAVEVKFTCGYGAAGSDCPAKVRECILEVVEDRLKNRGGMYRIASGTMEKLLALWPGRL